MLVPEQGAPEKVLLAGVQALTFTRGRLTTRWAFGCGEVKTAVCLV